MASGKITALKTLLLFCFSGPVLAALPQGQVKLEQNGVRMWLAPRTPEQIVAFYLGRGFPEAAAGPLADVCMVTVSIRNKRQETVWLEPARWRFRETTGEAVQRLDRDYWNGLWARMGVPLAKRATFRWSQLPEVRDLQPDEPVGGNVALRRPKGAFSLEARFHTGADKRGEEIVINIPSLVCPEGEDGAPLAR